jgi:ABC-2 type transport system permease protein
MILTIAGRELRSFFRVPMGWIVLALYLVFAGFLFVGGVLPREAGQSAPATLQPVVLGSLWIMLLLVPAISMRLISEELRSGTLEQLMTSPSSDGAIILGKFLGALAFVLALLAPTLLLVAALFAISDPAPDPGPIAAGYLSLALLAAPYLSVGLLVSTMTSNQTLAFVGTFVFLALTQIVAGGAVELPRRVAQLVGFISLRPRIEDFAKGVIDTGHVVFFLTVTAWFLVLAYVSLQMRRWR